MLAHEIVERMGHESEAPSRWPEESLKGSVPQGQQSRGFEEVVEIDFGQSIEQGRRTS